MTVRAMMVSHLTVPEKVDMEAEAVMTPAFTANMELCSWIFAGALMVSPAPARAMELPAWSLSVSPCWPPSITTCRPASIRMAPFDFSSTSPVPLTLRALSSCWTRVSSWRIRFMAVTRRE